jgi:hypothetical protein
MTVYSAPVATGRISPSTKNIMVGKGFVIFKRDDEDDYFHLGNVPSLSVTPKTTLLDHFDSQQGTKTKDLSIVTEKSMDMKLQMEEMTSRNLALLMLGDLDVTTRLQPVVNLFTNTTLTGHLKFFATNEQGPRQYLDLPSVQLNPSGDFSPISDSFANMEVSGLVNSVSGIWGTLTLHPAVGTVAPECLLDPFIDSSASDVNGGPKAQVDRTLQAYIGGWAGADAFSYQWKADGTPIYLAVEDTYKPVVGDIGKVITVTVTGTNDIGSTAATSDATLAVVAA